MTKWITAPPEHGIETSRDMDPHHPGTRILPGIARAHLTIHESGEECSTTLPTVAELLGSCVDPETGLLSIERYVGLPLRLDPAPLRDLQGDARVGPGYSFVTHEALPRRRRTSGSANQTRLSHAPPGPRRGSTNEVLTCAAVGAVRRCCTRPGAVTDPRRPRASRRARRAPLQ